MAPMRRDRVSSASVIFVEVRCWLGTILGRFSIINFRGLGLSIMVRVRVRVRVRLGLGLGLGLWLG